MLSFFRFWIICIFSLTGHSSLWSQSITVSGPLVDPSDCNLIYRFTVPRKLGNDALLSSNWSFGDGNTTSSAGGPTVSHSFENPGDYVVSVTAQYEGGQSLSLSTNVSVTSGQFSSQLVSFSINQNENQTEFIYTGADLPVNNFTNYTYNYQVSFGDGSDPFTSSPSNTPPQNGDILVSHQYSDDAQLDATLTVYCYTPENTLLCSWSETQTFAPEVSVCCINFAPESGKRYWVSAWVKEGLPNQVKSYENCSIRIKFTGSIDQFVFKPTGDIIDGWQRIVGEFVVPENVSDMQVVLKNEYDLSRVDVFFDDIRIHPFNASMKSYVYDPETLWLVAELDDNNYATFYEYDYEGQLIRIKKETSRGIRTIQESRSSNPKNDQE